MSRPILFKKTVNPMVWVTYEPGFRLQVPMYSQDKARELRERASEEITKIVAGKVSSEKVFDPDTFEALRADFLIADWDGPMEEDGSPAKATPENKLLLIKQYPQVADFVAAVAMHLYRHYQIREAELSENLSNTSAGNPEGQRTAKPAK